MISVLHYPGNDLCCITCTDTVTTREAITLTAEITRPGRPFVAGHCFIDAKNCHDTELVFADILRIRAMTVACLQRENIQLRVACHAVNDVLFGVSRMYEQVLNTTEWAEVYVSRNRQQALDWLGQPDPAILTPADG
ncbi:hypothetical protein [Tropicibacter naphthalenivorans]|uniref:STAS/SEC14 domain-containing protein n=1 Tax=Tropicibacter naphthalenivorans TaxID=441103 RepID=A0A0P1GDN5_9RHOB|nr:hypothetical protein [Tropicibacter naphthalenivorans]CUH79508.1 hypothetical protein TRN7648_02509 [Tropicibacter naphthalenivorans]SMC73251.1 hypothetical protein SAMN04488093_103138 [Tropicibacter naphthalenivorans]